MARNRTNADGALAEAPFQQQVVQLAAFYGWESYHTHDSRRSNPGFPDLVLVRNDPHVGNELLFVELKTDVGRVRPDQQRWLELLGAVAADVGRLVAIADDHGAEPGLTGVEVHVWRPRDFDELHARLSRGCHRTEPLYRSAAA